MCDVLCVCCVHIDVRDMRDVRAFMGVLSDQARRHPQIVNDERSA